MKYLKNKKGIAIIEFLFMFFIFVFTLVLIYGSWGIVHSSILHSIGARFYAWDNIRHRSNIVFIRDNMEIENAVKHVYWKKSSRFFVVNKKGAGEDFISHKLRVDLGGSDWSQSGPGNEGFLGLDTNTRGREPGVYQKPWEGLDNSLNIDQRNRRFKTSQVRLEIGYGICLTATCQPQ